MTDPRERLPEGSLCRACEHCFVLVREERCIREGDETEWAEDRESGTKVYCLKNDHAPLFIGTVNEAWEFRVSACTHYEPEQEDSGDRLGFSHS